jgi:hypothetical protein
LFGFSEKNLMGQRQIFTADEYRDFAVNLGREIEKRGLTITTAAKVLGVTRQTLHLHLRPGGKHQPRWSLVKRAVRVWDMVIFVQKQKFDRNAFGPDIVKKDPAVQLLLLPEAINRLGNANLEVTVLRKDVSSVALEVLVKFAG